MQTIHAFTDGSSLGNPGPGGYGAVLVFEEDSDVLELGGAERDTTNNRMELTAVIESLLSLRKEKGKIVFYLDSAYVLGGITKWVHVWEKNNWITSAKASVQNQDLWITLLDLVHERDETEPIAWQKLKGHSGLPGNERADKIATSFAENKPVELYEGDREEYEKELGISLLHMKQTKTPPKKSKSRKGEAYSYVSYVGGTIYIDKTWEHCEKRVKGVKGTKYKKAMNKQEEDDLIELYSKEDE